LFIRIAQRLYPYITAVSEAAPGIDMRHASAANADHGYVDAVVGADDRPEGSCAESFAADDQARGSHYACFYEVSSIRHFCLIKEVYY
jgi:hypothetical protein